MSICVCVSESKRACEREYKITITWNANFHLQFIQKRAFRRRCEKKKQNCMLVCSLERACSPYTINGNNHKKILYWYILSNESSPVFPIGREPLAHLHG